MGINIKRKTDRSYKHFIPQFADCSTVTIVNTSIYDVNTKCAVDTYTSSRCDITCESG